MPVVKQSRLRCLFNFYFNLGSFVVQKQRPSQGLAYIHSKPVVYVNNGGGRDTYISDFSGGLRVQYRPGHGKRTFYNNLRVYDKTNYGFGKRGHSHTATMIERNDTFSSSQNHFNPKFVREMSMVKNYQHMMDNRLSMPKKVQIDGERAFKNSNHKVQDELQRTFYRTKGEFSPIAENARSFDKNYASYTNLKQIKNTIDL